MLLPNDVMRGCAIRQCTPTEINALNLIVDEINARLGVPACKIDSTQFGGCTIGLNMGYWLLLSRVVEEIEKIDAEVRDAS